MLTTTDSKPAASGLNGDRGEAEEFWRSILDDGCDVLVYDEWYRGFAEGALAVLAEVKAATASTS